MAKSGIKQITANNIHSVLSNEFSQNDPFYEITPVVTGKHHVNFQYDYTVIDSNNNGVLYSGEVRIHWPDIMDFSYKTPSMPKKVNAIFSNEGDLIDFALAVFHEDKIGQARVPQLDSIYPKRDANGKQIHAKPAVKPSALAVPTPPAPVALPAPSNNAAVVIPAPPTTPVSPLIPAPPAAIPAFVVPPPPVAATAPVTAAQTPLPTTTASFVPPPPMAVPAPPNYVPVAVPAPPMAAQAATVATPAPFVGSMAVTTSLPMTPAPVATPAPVINHIITLGIDADEADLLAEFVKVMHTSGQPMPLLTAELRKHNIL